MSEPTLNFHVQARLASFRIPTELIKKNFKTIQKQIEKHKKQIAEDVDAITKSNLPPATKLEKIQKLIASFEQLQKKLVASARKDQELRSRLVARLENLQELSKYTLGKDGDPDRPLDLHDIRLINWYRDQANLLIVDYLIKSSTGSLNMGRRLLESLLPELRKLIDYDLFEGFNKVFTSIMEEHELGLVSAWFNENKNALKKINSNLEFEINYCRFLSLIKEGNVNEAIDFSKRHLSPYGNRDSYPEHSLKNYTHNLVKLKEIGGLLIYLSIEEQFQVKSTALYSSTLLSQSSRYNDYQRLLSDERWDSLSSCFIEDFNKIYGISKVYPLFVYLSAGLSSLKTKSCYCNNENTIFASHDESSVDSSLAVVTDMKCRGPNHYYRILGKINHCPACSPELFAISQNLPYAQLITHIFDKPHKLPNGNIYPFDKLLAPSEKYLTEKNTLLRMNKVKDPLTKEIFSISLCQRVYPA